MTASGALLRRISTVARATESSAEGAKLGFLKQRKNVASPAKAQLDPASPASWPGVAEPTLLAPPQQPGDALLSRSQGLAIPSFGLTSVGTSSSHSREQVPSAETSPIIHLDSSLDHQPSRGDNAFTADESAAISQPWPWWALEGRGSQDWGSTPQSSRTFLRAYHSRRPLSVVTASTNGRKAFFVDTLALVRRLEAEGMTAKQAEAITQVITDVLHESLESAGQTFVSKAEMQKSELMADAAMSRLRTELQSSSDIRLAGMQREVEGLKTDLDKVKSELKYEVDKVTSGQRLDLNLERGRVKEELNVQAQETSNLSNKLDREVNALKAQLEASKFEIIRYCAGTLVSVTAVGLGVLRVLM